MQRALYVFAHLIGVVLSVASPVVFQAQAPWPSPVEIRSVSDGMCLQPIDNSMDPGKAIVQETCTGGPEQIWFPESLVSTPTLAYQLRNGLSGLCLDARGAAANGTPVQQWICGKISNESWAILEGNGVPGILGSLVSGTRQYCLDVPEGNKNPGFAMQIYRCNKSASQQWQLQAQFPPPVAPPPIEISSVLDGMCLQPINRSMEPGAAIVQQACTGFPEQIWFRTLANGVTHLMNGLSGLCLDARGAADNKTPVQQWPCPNPGQLQITNENWETVGTSDKGALKSLVSGTTKYCLDVPEGNTAPGVAMWIYSCNNTAAQTWQFQAQNPPPGLLASPPIGISSALSGMCLQPNNKSMEPGAAIVEETCAGLPEQVWIWMTLPNGVSHLMNGLSGLCLDARGAAADSTPVQQWPCNQISNESWEAVAAVGTPDKEILKSRVSGTSNYCLDVPGGSSAGLPAQINSCNNSASQIWRLGGQSTVVPNVFGWQAGAPAAVWIEGFDLVPQLQLPASMSLCNSNSAGRIVGEVPAPGTPVLRSSAVTLYFCPSS